MRDESFLATACTRPENLWLISFFFIEGSVSVFGEFPFGFLADELLYPNGGCSQGPVFGMQRGERLRF